MFQDTCCQFHLVVITSGKKRRTSFFTKRTSGIHRHDSLVEFGRQLVHMHTLSLYSFADTVRAKRAVGQPSSIVTIYTTSASPTCRISEWLNGALHSGSRGVRRVRVVRPEAVFPLGLLGATGYLVASGEGPEG